MLNKYIVPTEIQKYPYCGRTNCDRTDETEDYLSEKICCYTINIRKKFIRKLKILIFYGDSVFRLVPSQAIGLVMPPQTPVTRRIIDSNAEKQTIIAQVIQQMPAEINFNQKEINELYQLSVECKNNSLSQEEVLNKITNLRGGSFVDVAAGLIFIAGVIILLNDANAFQPNPRAIVPPHLQWLYGNNHQPGQFGYCLLYTSPSPRDLSTSRMPSSA